MSCTEEQCENHDATVHIEENEDGDYTLLRNGKPFYIKGGAAHPDYLAELKAAGANTARIYDTINLQQVLDKAESLQLAVVVDIPLPKFSESPEYYEDKELFHKIKRKVGKVVYKFRNHPALLYWNLGNELYYPYGYKRTKFYSNYNELIDIIHRNDPNHLVSTTTIGANKLRILSIITRSPQLDFISFNSFGVLSQFTDKIKPISLIWNGPYVISEWGVNGPWEASETNWMVPVEETSSKKAELIKDRFSKYLEPMEKNGALGSFVFYWGAKNEVTPTWYSLFSDKDKTEGVFAMNKIWKNSLERFPGPKLEYFLINKKGPLDNLILSPNETATAEIYYPSSTDHTKFDIQWELRHESWVNMHESEVVANVKFAQDQKSMSFSVPNMPGPYRLFLYISNDTEYIATANFPFYVLNPNNEN